MSRDTTLDLDDLGIVALLLAAAVLLNLLGLGSLEFLRHTEADRTLIAWEMVESGNYVVPHLLGSPILTKPPLYYWLAAFFIKIFGGAQEWIARLPSAFASLLFVLVQYLILRSVGWAKKWSALGTIVLATSMAFFTLATLAELDMLHGLLCGFSLYGAYFAVQRRSVLWTLVAYGAASLAFLTKGPPIILFLGVTQLGFYFWHRRWPHGGGEDRKRQSVRQFAAYNAIGVATFSLLVCLWLLPLAARVGWTALGSQLRVEFVDRIAVPGVRERGPFFYLGAMIGGLSPWSVFLVAGLLTVAAERASRSRLREMPCPDFLAFNLIVLLPGLAMLSLAQGKASRYFFPIHVFAVNLAVYALFLLRGSSAERVLFWLGKILSSVVVVGLVAASFVTRLQGVSRLSILVAAWVIAVCWVVVGVGCWKERGRLVIAGLALCALGLRLGQMWVYNPYQNARRSVKGIAQELNAKVPSEAPLYTVELFERWVIYYLKRGGRDVKRLTPTIAEAATEPRRAFLLLKTGSEQWRVDLLRARDATLRVAGEFEAGGTQVMLVEAEASKLRFLRPSEEFPTKPSVPFSQRPEDDTR